MQKVESGTERKADPCMLLTVWHIWPLTIVANSCPVCAFAHLLGKGMSRQDFMCVLVSQYVSMVDQYFCWSMCLFVLCVLLFVRSPDNIFVGFPGCLSICLSMHQFVVFHSRSRVHWTLCTYKPPAHIHPFACSFACCCFLLHVFVSVGCYRFACQFCHCQCVSSIICQHCFVSPAVICIC